VGWSSVGWCGRGGGWVRAAGASFWRLCVGHLHPLVFLQGAPHFSGEFCGGPFVAGEDFAEEAVGADDDRAEIVIGEGAVAFHCEAEGGAETFDFGAMAGGENPVGGIGVKTGGVSGEAFGGVEIGVEGDGEEAPIWSVGGGLEGGLGGGELAIQAGAEIGEGAAGEDEGDGEGLAAQIVELEGGAVGIDEAAIGEWATGGDGRRRIVAGRDGDGAGAGDFGELIGDALRGGDGEAESDWVAGVKAGEIAGIGHGELHGHRFHVTGYFFVSDDGGRFLGADFLQDAADFEALD